jgi:hypothetical protein
MPNTQNVIFIEFASDLEESRIKVPGDALSSCCLIPPGQYASPIPKLEAAISRL